MSLAWSCALPKTALCDFAMRYKLKPIDAIAGNKRKGRSVNPAKTVE